ncbi:MAG TPA: hypothetical protein VGQ83_00055 [Polyangia bacterium]
MSPKKPARATTSSSTKKPSAKKRPPQSRAAKPPVKAPAKKPPVKVPAARAERDRLIRELRTQLRAGGARGPAFTVAADGDDIRVDHDGSTLGWVRDGGRILDAWITVWWDGDAGTGDAARDACRHTAHSLLEPWLQRGYDADADDWDAANRVYLVSAVRALPDLAALIEEIRWAGTQDFDVSLGPDTEG